MTTLSVEGPPALTDGDFLDGLAAHARIREKYTLSSHPRSEAITGCMVFTAALAAMVTLLSRLTVMSADAIWLLYSFLLPLAYHLLDTATASLGVVDEIVYRACWRCGVRAPFYRRRCSWPDVQRPAGHGGNHAFGSRVHDPGDRDHHRPHTKECKPNP
jgi:hypothetical protein